MSNPVPHPIRSGHPMLEWVLLSGEAHHVSDFAELVPGDRPQVMCPVCDEPLTLKLGKKIAHHAAHRAGSACSATKGEGKGGAGETNERFRDARRRADGEAELTKAIAPHPGLARVILIGFAGAVPTVVYPAGVRTARISVATHRGRKTHWHQVVADGEIGRVAEVWIRKGATVLVEGDICHRRYLDRSGAVQNITEIRATTLLPLDD